MLSMRCGRREAANAAQGNQPSLVQTGYICAVIRQHLHFPLLSFLQEPFSPAP